MYTPIRLHTSNCVTCIVRYSFSVRCCFSTTESVED